jgi:hypothetical protein
MMPTPVSVNRMVKDQDGVWQGTAFSEYPPWLIEYMKSGNMGIVPNMPFIHAVWAIKTGQGIMVLEPGDRFANDDMFGIVVEKHSLNKLTWENVKPTDEEVPDEPPKKKRAPPRKKTAAKPKSKTVSVKKTTRTRKKAPAKKSVTPTK